MALREYQPELAETIGCFTVRERFLPFDGESLPIPTEATVRRMLLDHLHRCGTTIKALNPPPLIERQLNCGVISAAAWLTLMCQHRSVMLKLHEALVGMRYSSAPRVSDGCSVMEPLPEDEGAESLKPLFQYTVSPAIADAGVWAEHASSILQRAMKARNVDVTGLYTIFCHMELDYGMPTDIARKINSGRFSAVFFLQVLRALEVWSLELN